MRETEYTDLSDVMSVGRRPSLAEDWAESWRRWSPLVLVVILMVATYLRFTNLDWDEGQWIHPDEGHMRTILSAIRIPDDPSLYFDTHNSPLNCRNRGQIYSYGTLPLFLVRFAAEGIDRACGDSPNPVSAAVASLFFGLPPSGCRTGTFTGFRSAEVGRALSALADVGTVLLIYLIARRLYGEATGLLAAAFGALTAFLIQQAHFFTVDSMACFFVTLTAYFAVRAGQSGGWGSFALAGAATGLATACKVSAAPAALLVALAAVWRVTDHESDARFPSWSLLLKLALAGLLALVAFRVAQPYAFEGPGFFGLQPSPEWVKRLGQIRREQSGHADMPPNHQWTNRTPLVFPWVNMVVWGMGLPLGLAAWIGWAFAGLELWRGRRIHLILWSWTGLMFLYLGTRWVKSMRYFIALYPLLIVMGAYLLVRLCRASSPRWRRVGYGVMALVVIGALFWAGAFLSIYRRSHTRLAASRWIIAHVPEGSTVANEHWDWGLPLRVDGHDPFGGMYQGLSSSSDGQMQNYHEDTAEKREQLFAWLDEADYIFLASNRLYGSIARLPARYPLTTEYYRALFAGELGFELAADFTSYPALGPFQFPDQEIPYALMEPRDYDYQTQPIEVPLPPAEEAFSVYDHPRVLIFRKTGAYSRELVERRLGDIDVERALHGLTPTEATAARGGLEYDAETWADQQAGGTWSEMFNRRGLFNRYPGLAAVAWWLVVTLLGWLAFPLAFVALPRLHDRGYGLARVLGLLLVAYLTWLVASLHVLPNTRGTILRMLLFLALVGGGVGWFRRGELRRFVRHRWRLLLLMEGLFALLYLAWIGVRLLHPDLWHPSMGGEKPMDFAYLNAVIKSTWFPPYNPWFSGSYINYYYFGFVIVGTLIKLMGTVPSIAYNLVVPLLFALTGVGAFSVACNLFGGHRRGAVLAGLMALTFVVLLGNLGVVHLLRDRLIELGGELFPSTIPGFPETVALFRGLWRLIAHGERLPVRTESWYWHPTRIIPGEAGNAITEFPAFTFLYGDLHAHMIAFPLTLLALALAVYWARAAKPRWSSLLMGGLVIGALRPTNTWDYPTYLVLGLVALAVGILVHRPPQGAEPRARFRSFAGRASAFVALTFLLYLPYIRHYATGYASVERWQGLYTSAGTYLWIHGILLFPLATRMLIEGGRRLAQVSGRMSLARLALVIGSLVGGAVVLTVVPVAMGYAVALVVAPVAVLAAMLILTPGMPNSRRLLWLMVGEAMALSLVVEVVVLKGDIGRMNTVFKFYLQVWILLSIAAAVSLAWVREHARRWRPEWRQLWWIGMMALILGGALFLPYGVRARAVDRMTPGVGLTLDGMAFAKRGILFDGDQERGAQQISLAGDYAAIRWMQDHVEGSPVIMEGLGYREYLWANRVSIHTGLPAVIGWRWHQVQQRLGVLPGKTVDWRRNDVRLCYNTADISVAQGILDRYGVRYVYVGDYERAYYDLVGLTKFDVMAAQELLRVVYDAQGVRIYEVVQ